MKPKMLVIFDMDGTLVASTINYEQIKVELKELLQNILTEEEHEVIKNQKKSILELTKIISKNDETGKVFEKAWEIIEHYELEGYNDLQIQFDVKPTLEKLKDKGHIVTIFTNNSTKLTDIVLKKYGFAKYIDYSLTRDDVTDPKPNPEGLLKLMKKYNCTEKQTLFVGDAWLDAEAAKKANIKFVYLTQNHQEQPSVESCDYVINNLEEIIKIVEMSNK